MTTTEMEQTALWKSLEQKFCIDLKKDFSNKDVEGWMNHFVPNEKINVYQHQTGKTTKIYTGNFLSSILRGRIPATLMATIYFKKLAKQHYSHSEIELLGVKKNTEKECLAKAHIRFLRFNTSGEMYESAIGIYELKEIKEKWYISEMSIYEDNDKTIPKMKIDKMWHLKK